MDSYLSSTINPRIKSFLSPSQKYNQRSFSTSECSHFYSGEKINTNPYLPDYRKPKNTQKISLDDYKKSGTFIKSSKLIKLPTKNKWDVERNREERQRKYQNDGEDLHTLIRELKKKAGRLEAENNELLKKQETDLQMIRKQNQTIITLRQVLSNQNTWEKEKKVSYSYDNELLRDYEEEIDWRKTSTSSNFLNCTECFGEKKEKHSPEIQELAFLKVKEERKELRDQYRSLMVQFEEQKHELEKMKKLVHGMRDLGKIQESWIKVSEERNKTIDEIDSLLFCNGF